MALTLHRYGDSVTRAAIAAALLALFACGACGRSATDSPASSSPTPVSSATSTPTPGPTATPPGAAARREAIAKFYAPVIFQETNDARKDLFAAFDYDGDWVGTNNAENIPSFPLIATVYYTVIETSTHWFVQYLPYHPLDWKVTDGHEHDTESILMVVAKSGGENGTLQAMEVRFHTVWYQYAIAGVGTNADNVDGPIHFDATSGRPAVYSQMVGHGLCGGFSPPVYAFPDLSLICDHSAEPHIETAGVVYSPDAEAAEPQVVDHATVKAGYRLVELYDSWWAHVYEIGSGKAFKSAQNYGGERCNLFQCPSQFGGPLNGDQGSSPSEAWGQTPGNGMSAAGDQFFDPAFTMTKRLTWPGSMSTDYCFNPYVGVADSC